jgi:HPt (histidine-containing phosphotransfer) domain-containing protein
MQLMAEDSGLFQELVRIYLGDYPKFLSRLTQAIAAGDADQIAYLAHTIKGMLSVFAVEDIADIAAHIEANPGADHQADLLALTKGLDWLTQELIQRLEVVK